MLRLKFVLGVATLVLGAGAALGVTAFRALEPPRYSKELTATGLVEEIRYLGLRRYCVIEVATHTWINLSVGFALQDVPQEGERYALYAPKDACVAAEVAAAAGNGHILYRAREEAGRWYLYKRPEAALGCGGLLTWQPPPRED